MHKHLPAPLVERAPAAVEDITLGTSPESKKDTIN
jgi:hypothetical protein